MGRPTSKKPGDLDRPIRATEPALDCSQAATHQFRRLDAPQAVGKGGWSSSTKAGDLLATEYASKIRVRKVKGANAGSAPGTRMRSAHKVAGSAPGSPANKAAHQS